MSNAVILKTQNYVSADIICDLQKQRDNMISAFMEYHIFFCSLISQNNMRVRLADILSL